MRQLEIKDIVGYLPYGLKILRPDGKTVLEVEGLASGLLIFSEHNEPDWTYGELRRCKPILYDISCLTEEIEVNGEKFVPCEKLNIPYRLSSDLNSENIINMPHKVIQKLYEWHFDFFDLIGKGLAINKMDLQK